MSLSKPRRRGRPATVTKERISDAVINLAKEGHDVTMQNVADELKVDITTLYRHIGGRQELSRFLAEDAAPSPDLLPDHHGKTAREWLREVAWFYWRLIHGHSELMKFSHSVIDPKLELLDHVVGVLIECGFTPKAASYSYYFLLDVLVGFIYQQIRDEEEKVRGGGRFLNYQRNITARPKAELRNILACQWSPEDFEVETAFEVFLTFTLDGICAQLDERANKK